MILFSSLSIWFLPAQNSIANAPKIGDFKADYENIVFDKNSSLMDSNELTGVLKSYLAEKSAEYGNGGNYYELYKVIECESSWNSNAIGDLGKAFGLAQFHKPTFDRFCEGEYKNPFDQIKCFVKMAAEKGQQHWTCFKLLKS